MSTAGPSKARGNWSARAAPNVGAPMTAAMLSTMVLCFALTVSVAVSIGLASILGIQVGNANMLISVKEMFNAINKFPLAAIPFFILAGNIMETGGISRRLVEFAKSLVGGVQGGLPMTCVLTCMIFAAVSGSSVATTFAIGAILIPALIKHGYPTHLCRRACRPPAPSWA
jgi:C4-dicarboxylate transporter DctM subunit